MTQSFEKAAGGVGPEGTLDRTPLETFILQELEPKRHEINDWGSVKGHTRLLATTARGRRLHIQRIGGKKSRAYTLSRSGVRLGGIDEQVTTLVSHQALRASASRELTRQYLALSDVPHLPARTFHISQGKAAAAFMDRLGQPVSIKPSSTRARGGSAANLTTAQQLAEAWERAGAACSELAAPRQQVDVEAFLPWVPLRLFVVGEEVVAAVARIPLYVMGDGDQTAHALAEKELHRRNSCAFLERMTNTNAHNLLESLSVDPGTVLRDGDLLVLSHDRIGQRGVGWSVDVTERISPELAALGINATWAFPGLRASAVDMLLPSLSEGHRAIVAHLEPGADLTEFRYPAFGKAQYPNLAIIQRISEAQSRE
ncbi:hypothetical protein [Garicola koreensis]|uniref:D-alanine-D-alanine ligase-like ATP-grasp enzyme n=1 Tax=Garicola koreensis TaxID=1262554 RepID=A0A7W5XP81_9MICC|nr:hypothetical protein [Garicola koreensis]MBB3667612.1 D-alanine-D-alanine ligase-like ATP-grasp enzyme [Garicola koreensis]